MSKSQHLYRHFDNKGDLLYVGVSIHTINRLVLHERNSSWFDDIATITIENFETRREVLLAEAKAVIDEKPRYNINHRHENIDDFVSDDEIIDCIYDENFRKKLVESYLSKDISEQINLMRKQSKWSQKTVGEKAGMAQERISVLESKDYNDYTLNVLKRIASAFDVAIMVKFISFSDLLKDMAKVDKKLPTSFMYDKIDEQVSTEGPILPLNLVLRG